MRQGLDGREISDVNKKTLIALVIVFAATCALLFNVFYKEARNTAITKLNAEQIIHAKQAARGIEEFFATWTGILTSLSKMDEIIDTDTVGKRYMNFFYEAHQEQIRSITRMDEKGIILYTLPFSRSIGSDISGQKHVREILRDHRPVISDVFKTVQGFDAVALHVPVFKGATFKGTIAIVINFESLAKRYLDVIRIGATGYAWVVSRDGTQIYSPIPGFTGKSVFENFKDYPSIIVMVNDMLKDHEGVATYTFDRIADRNVGQIKKYAVYMPIHIDNTFWSIVVASAEQDVLSGLISFRNRLIIIIGAIFICGILFSILGAKAWGIVAEEEKRKQVETELRNSEQRYRHLFEQNPAPMLIYQRGTLKMLAVNDAFTHHYGYTNQEALSLSLTDLYPEEEKKSIAELAASLKGHAYAGEWHHIKADGSLINIEAKSHDIDYWGHDARIAVITDITGRKQAENALRYSEEKFFKAFHATPDAIVISRASDGLLLEVNEVFLQQTGYSRDDALNRSAMELNLWADAHDRERYVAAVKSEGRVREMEARFRTKSGKVLDGLVSGESIVLGAQPCMLTIIRDITERKKTEEELEKYRLHLEDLVGERTTELEVANEKLRELDQLKSMFIASMSHELRTPLNSIIGFTGILLQGLAGPLNEEQRKQLGMVKGSSHHLLELITDIIDISKIEAGKISLSPGDFDLSSTAREVLESFQPAAGRKLLKLTIEAPGQLQVRSDERRVRQVLVNLIGNAVKFTSTGEVSVSAKGENNSALVAVRDTGPGIRTEDMGRLFQFFSQITYKDMPKHEGTGLGLYLSKKLMNLLGGDIQAKSEFGKGSVFTMVLPLKEMEQK